jgi:IS30 family transposase
MNRLKVSLQQFIITLAARGWSKRRIARELNVDRATVRRQLNPAPANPRVWLSEKSPGFTRFTKNW